MPSSGVDELLPATGRRRPRCGVSPARRSGADGAAMEMDPASAGSASGTIHLSGGLRCGGRKNNVPTAGTELKSGLIVTERGTYLMTNLNHINGIVPIITTPFTPKEEVDWSALRKLVAFARETGACAGCLPAYACEFSKLAERERRQIVTEAVQHA